MGYTSTVWSFGLLIASSFPIHKAAAAPGQATTVSSWKVQSSSKTGDDVAKLSNPNLDTSSWYGIGSRGTLMATLLENKVYNETDLFFSNNLEKVDSAQFRVPWYYRSDINLSSSGGSYFQLRTHGISSRADIYFNGKTIADKNVQAGAYTGLAYDITKQVKSGNNTLLIKAYPTDYNRDLALGFVDWNPYPPDNGTGVWRGVQITETGPVSISSPRAISTLRPLEAHVSIRLDVQNWSNRGVQGEVTCQISDPQGNEVGNPRAEFRLSAGKIETLTFNVTISNPHIWWPRQWGAQPLYTTTCTASTGAGVSDRAPPTKFGIRTVTSNLNSYNDTTFYINDRPFQVIGAGYTSDMFLRFSPTKLRAQFEYILDMGLNTVRLEGKQEHPYLYSMADEMGLMIMAGWECCDKWEGWTYNDEGSGITWTDPDYDIANKSMRHEAEMMQSHPSMLAFLVGSDFWPDDRATMIYVDALRAFDWNIPIISSASQRGYPKLLGNGGMKMDGPYDWVPPNYWGADKLGGAFGFGSELGAGVGTPELSSLKKFLSKSDMDDLWKNPDKGLYHMSTSVSSFYTRKIYNDALWARYGAPTSLDDYILKSQMADYEATRAQFEAYASHWGASRKATGLIYWMLNNAWPSLHWNLFDYYLHSGGSYFGTKMGARMEHVSFDYSTWSVWMTNRAIDKGGMRTVEVEMVDLKGRTLWKADPLDVQMRPNEARWVVVLPMGGLEGKGTVLLRLVMHDKKRVISRNVYWLSAKEDELDWDNSTWYHTPVSSYANYTDLATMPLANLTVTPSGASKLTLQNTSPIPAVFIRLNLVDSAGDDIVPVRWSENYITLFPGEKMDVTVSYDVSSCWNARVQVSGRNVKAGSVQLG
ncbi:glycoside hydrolase [Westerdykella ornata]|uniref:Glycoside hydrolase n=1 Tax=Westerdykella ornata TaxID=318751 RepID=A0A6A6JAI6_WESOR|nr:glycoside hydrolase [Westerdykella ornata]KAF2272636.1 glycoside hydrolase [Westerdykella ornata]